MTLPTTPEAARPSWREALAPYAQPDPRRTTIDVLTSLVPYLGLFAAMVALRDVSIWLSLALAPLAAGFLLRTYILFHDATHGSLLPSQTHNTWVGRVIGVFVFSPYTAWKRNHVTHHA